MHHQKQTTLTTCKTLGKPAVKMPKAQRAGTHHTREAHGKCAESKHRDVDPRNLKISAVYGSEPSTLPCPKGAWFRV